MYLNFHRRFNLIEAKETDVLRDLELALRLTDDPAPPSSESNSSSSSTATATTTTATTTTTTTNTTSSNGSHNNNNCNQSTATSSSTTSSAKSNATNNVDDSHHTSLIDGDANVQPICTQPESGTQPPGDGGGDRIVTGGGLSCSQQTETA